jgi:heme/copper-type cytochrome/quinol oxidase subunit 4
MKYCKYCNLHYNTPLDHCLFCNNELMKTNLKSQEQMMEQTYHYPEFQKRKNSRRFLLRFFSFLGLIAMITCVYIDLSNPITKGLSWSRYVISPIAYFLLFLSIITSSRKSIQKTIYLPYLTLLFLVYLGSIGNSSVWSVDFVMPLGFISINITMLFFLLIKKKRHHDYSIYCMTSSIIGILPIILLFNHSLTYTWPTITCFLYSLTSFLGILIFTPEATKEELKRRLHL